MTEEEFLKPLPIANDHYVYRQVHVSQLEKVAGDKKKRFPKAAHFVPDPDGLSTHWTSHIDVHSVYHIIGLSYRYQATDFKNYREFKVFALPVAFLRSLEAIKDVEHSPVLNGNPAPIGSPNNFAHASVIYLEEDVDVRLKLSNFCNEKYDATYQIVDLEQIDAEVEDLRKRLQNTQYHRLDFQGEHECAPIAI